MLVRMELQGLIHEAALALTSCELASQEILPHLLVIKKPI